MEEEIEVLEEHIEFLKRNDVEDMYGDFIGEILAIENLLTRYKQLEEENKHLASISDYETICMQCNHLEEQLDIANDKVKEIEKENQSYRDYFGNPPCYDDAKYISASKIKEKIEEITKQEKEELKGMKGQDRYFVKQMYNYKRQGIEELLESGD